MIMNNYVPDYNLEPPKAPKYLPCPVCGADLYDYIVLDIDDCAIGCSACTKHISAEEYVEHEEDYE